MSSTTLPPKIADDLSGAVALLAAFWQAPDGRKLDDPVFAALLDETVGSWQASRDSTIALLLLTHRLLDEADDPAAMLVRAGLRIAREREAAG